MHSARPNGPLQNKHHERVQRTDSVKSERSDKRVSFNKDVGVKHIPRGQKSQAKQLQKALISDFNKDEWASCAPVRLELPPSSVDEKEKEASDLVRLLDQVSCSTAPEAPTHPKYTSKSLDRLIYKNNKNNRNDLINNTRNNIGNVNHISDSGSKPHLATRTANKINRSYKSDVNEVNASPIINQRNYNSPDFRGNYRRSLSPQYSSEYTDQDSGDRKLYGFKSVPDLTLYYDNKEAYRYHFQDYLNNTDPIEAPSKSIDNLLVGNTPNLLYKERANSSANTYRSADNLIEVSHYPDYPLPGFKSVDNLISPTYSNIDIIKANNMPTDPHNYRPKVGNMIKKFNAESDNLRVRSHLLDTVGGLTEPDSHRNHNQNQPFSYIDPPLTSVQEIKKISPPRETRPSDIVYAQVNKHDRHAKYINRDFDKNHRGSVPYEHEYSAKIIITDERDKNNFRNNEDDAYETYEVQNNKLTKVNNSYDSKKLQDFGLRITSDDLMDEYKNLSYNNINMSSVGVQTDALPKAPNRNKKTIKTHVNPSSREIPTRKDQENYLVSSSLVRQVNHGFGRTDRSPSPPMKLRGVRPAPKVIVPLLSDTSDSEADYRIRADPLAKIRDQVMIREKLQEDQEAEELAEREDLEASRREIFSYNPDEMRPLTLDEVDALSLEVDKNGRKSIVVARATSSNNDTSRNTSSLSRQKSNTLTREKVNTVTRNDSISKSNFDSLNRNSDTLSRKPSQNNDRVKNNTFKRESRLDQNQKEKKSIFGSSSPTRLFSTFERNKKNNSDKEQIAKKDKKKKRIKIKFFYDPRPQDNNNVDPLSRFTEYKGTSSDEKPSPINNTHRTNSIDRRQEKIDNSRSRSRDTLYNSKNRRDIRDSSTENHRNRHESPKDSYKYGRDRTRDNSREYSGDNTPRREPKDNKYKEMQRGRSTSAKSSNNDERRSNYNSMEYSKRSIDRREDKNGMRVGDRSIDRRENRSRDRKLDRSIDRRDQRDINRIEDRSRRDAYETRNGSNRHNTYRSLDRKNSGNRSDSVNVKQTNDAYHDYDSRGSPDGRPSRTLSEKYKGASLFEPKMQNSNNNISDETEIIPKIKIDGPDIASEPKKKTNKKKKKKMWPWSFLGLRGSSGKTSASEAPGMLHPPRTSSRASSRASKASSRSSFRGSHRPKRPSVRAAKIRRDGPDGKIWLGKDRLPPAREPDWESVTLNRGDLKSRQQTKDLEPVREYESSQYISTQNTRKLSAESSDSYKSPTRTNRVTRGNSFKQRYFGDSDVDTRSKKITSNGDFRSLPNRSNRANVNRQNSQQHRMGRGTRGMSPTAQGSAGSSLQSSESEADSRQGSHASRVSKVSHVSTESNRSVYLHATAVADIPVHRVSEDTPSEGHVTRQAKRVSRSFSLVAPWKPRHYREKFDVEYDRDGRHEVNRGRSALPPRPPRRVHPEPIDPKKVSRSQSVYKDSKLAGWLRRRRHKEMKGI